MNYPKYTVVLLSLKNKHISQAPDVLLLPILPHGPPYKGKTSLSENLQRFKNATFVPVLFHNRY